MRRAVSVTALPLVGGGLTAGCTRAGTGDQGRDRVSPPGGGTR